MRRITAQSRKHMDEQDGSMQVYYIIPHHGLDDAYLSHYCKMATCNLSFIGTHLDYKERPFSRGPLEGLIALQVGTIPMGCSGPCHLDHPVDIHHAGTISESPEECINKFPQAVPLSSLLFFLVHDTLRSKDIGPMTRGWNTLRRETTTSGVAHSWFTAAK